MQRTSNMQLLLYEANDIMQTTDFVNQNNQTIDTYTSEVKIKAEEASASATTANQGVAAADAKIVQIQNSITQNQLSSLPQFKTDTKNRLDALEDDVAGLSGWTTPFKEKDGLVSHHLMVSSIGLYMSNRHAVPPDAWTQVTEVLKMYVTNAVTTGLTFKSEYGFAQGNIFNLPSVNEYYIYPYYYMKSSGTLKSGGVGVKWTGVQTVFAVLGTENADSYFNAGIFPIIKK